MDIAREKSFDYSVEFPVFDLASPRVIGVNGRRLDLPEYENPYVQLANKVFRMQSSDPNPAFSVELTDGNDSLLWYILDRICRGARFFGCWCTTA